MYEKDQLLLRTQGTAWRLGLAACLVCLLPILAYGFTAVYMVGVAFYLAIMLAIAAMTLFTLLFNDTFRSMISSFDASKISEICDSISRTLKPVIPWLAAAGILLCVASILIGLKMRGVRRAKSGFIAGIVIACLTIIAVVLYYTVAVNYVPGRAV